MTVSLLAMSGSLRAASTNTAVLRTAIDMADEGVLGDVAITLHSLRGLPMYDGDLEAAGQPAAVTELRRGLATADGLLIATPEYNWSVPAVLKNAIDWASRGPDSPLTGLPTAVASAAGGGGGRRVQAHLREVFAHNAVDLLDDGLMIPRSRDHVHGGRLQTPALRDALADLVRALADRVARRGSVAA